MTKKSRRIVRARRALLSLSLVLVMMMVAVGGTIAWLTDATTAITNTFTDSNVNITLTEPAGVTPNYEFTMVPGSPITKDPQVTVDQGSEPAWIFVKIEKSTTPVFDNYLEYEIDTSKWIELSGPEGEIWYGYNEVQEYGDDAIHILKGDKVTVKTSVTEDMMNAIRGENSKPTIKFTAYAIQSANIPGTGDAEATVLDAWNAYYTPGN